MSGQKGGTSFLSVNQVRGHRQMFQNGAGGKFKLMYSIFKDCFHRDAQIIGNNNPLCRQKGTIRSNRTCRGSWRDVPVLLERGQRGQAEI